MKLSWGLLIAVLVVVAFSSMRSVFAFATTPSATKSGEITSGESTARTHSQVLRDSLLTPPVIKLPQTGSTSQSSSDNILEENTALDIPKINVHTLLYRGTMLGQELSLGKNEILEYSNIIYAHNSTGTFGQIVNLQPGDMVYKTVNKVVTSYVVLGSQLVDENYTGILANKPNTLFLITCDFTTPRLRVVVTAEKIPEN